MQEALANALGSGLSGADALVMTAAVADYRPAEPAASKMKRTGEAMTLELVPNKDLLAEVGAARVGSHPVLVGFALETDEGEALVAHARDKLSRKKVDFIVANSASAALGGETSRAILVTPSTTRDLGSVSKSVIADEILDFVLGRLHGRDAKGA